MSINKQIAVYVTTNTKSIEEGEWVDLTRFSNEENFLEYCKKLHEDEKDPEFIFQYFQGFPEAYYGESKLDPDLWGYLERIKTHDKEIIDTLIENFYSYDQDHLIHYVDYEKFGRDLCDERTFLECNDVIIEVIE